MKKVGAIFDLDGVIVDTAKYHYLAWRRLAQEMGFDFSVKDNERLKGVSRMRSLEILLETGGVSGFSEAELLDMATRKNAWYVEYITKMQADEILPGAAECLKACRANGIKTALGSASRNSGLILDNLGLRPLFDAIVDGNRTQRAKPDPEVFLLAASDLGLSPEECIVFEDAQAGIDAAKAGGMMAIAIGKPEDLEGYDGIYEGLFAVDVKKLFGLV